MAQLKAIETSYKGYRFRSRLEARWAVFFDHMGLKWEYEPQGFRLPSGQLYLPDFKVYGPGGQPCVYEIKAANTNGDGKYQEYHAHRRQLWADLPAHEKAKKFAPRGNLLRGDPVEFLTERRNTLCPRCGVIAAFGGYQYSSGPHEGHQIVYCHPCLEDIGTRIEAGKYRDNDLSTYGFPNVMVTRSRVRHEGKPDHCLHLRRSDYMHLKYDIEAAASAARKARFEHGEQP